MLEELQRIWIYTQVHTFVAAFDRRAIGTAATTATTATTTTTTVPGSAKVRSAGTDFKAAQRREGRRRRRTTRRRIRGREGTLGAAAWVMSCGRMCQADVYPYGLLIYAWKQIHPNKQQQEQQPAGFSINWLTDLTFLLFCSETLKMIFLLLKMDHPVTDCHRRSCGKVGNWTQLLPPCPLISTFWAIWMSSFFFS